MKKKKSRPRTVYHNKHVMNVSAIALLFKGQPAGKFIAAYDKAGKEDICKATLSVWKGPLRDIINKTAITEGIGYEKIADCLAAILQEKAKILKKGRFDLVHEFEAWGYDAFEVL